MTRLSVDFTNMMTPSIGETGVDPEVLKGTLTQAFATAYEEVEARRTRRMLTKKVKVSDAGYAD